MVPAPRTPAAPRRRRFSPAAVLLASLALAGCATAQQQSATTASARLAEQNSMQGMLQVAARTESSGNAAAARKMYAQIAARHPDQPAGHLGLGRTSYRTGDPAEAAQHYRTALTHAPESVTARYGLGKALLAADRPEAAIEQFDDLIAREAADTRPYVAKGVALDMLGRHAQAQTVYRSGLDLAPMNVALRTNLGLSLALAGDYKTALRVLEDAARDPKASPRTRQNLALVYGLAGEMEDAAAAGSADLAHGAVQRNLAYYRALREARAITDAAARTRAVPDAPAPTAARTQLAAREPSAAAPALEAEAVKADAAAQPEPEPEPEVETETETKADTEAEPRPARVDAPTAPVADAAPVALAPQADAAPAEPATAATPAPASPAGETRPTGEPVADLAPDSSQRAAKPAGVVQARFSPTPAPDHALADGGRRYWVQVASLRSQAEAQAEWDRLQDAHAPLLAQLPLALQKTDLPEKGTYYRLRSGPFVEAGTPKQLCQALKARDQACLVVRSGPKS